MKFTLSLIVLILVSSITLFAQKNYKSEGSRKKTITIKTKVYCDHCNKCETCKSRIEEKIFQLKGIRSVEMNTVKQTIKVIYNPKFAKPQLIKEQIAAAGYDADDVIATKEQIAGLDDCCLKKD
jgi:periplasmic mercuric ion binding protein